MSIKPFRGLRSRFLTPRRSIGAVPLQLCWLRPRFLVTRIQPLHLQLSLHFGTANSYPATRTHSTWLLSREILRFFDSARKGEPSKTAWPIVGRHNLIDRRRHTSQVLRQHRRVQVVQMRQAPLPTPVRQDLIHFKRLEMVVRHEAGKLEDKRARVRAQQETVSRTRDWPASASGDSPARTPAAELELTKPLLNHITDEVVRSIDRRLLAYRERMGSL